jgi:isopenicillin N synthase-like dioxygenase
MDIPVLDLGEAADPSAGTFRNWESAMVDVGCFGLVNHGIATAVRDACVAATAAFHAQPRAWKDGYDMSRSMGNKGYLGDDFRSAGEGTNRVVRDYASLDLGPESASDPAAVESILLGPNQWPDMASLRTPVTAYYQAINAVAAVTSRMVSRVCGLDPDYLARRSERGCSLLRLLHYPRPAQDLEEPPNGHTDYEWFTLIWQSSPGLEVLGRDGVTRHAPASPDTITVLMGDLVEVLSGGQIESTLHWVRPREPDRYSLTFFYGPDYDETVAPTAPRRLHGDERFPALHAGHHLTALRVRHLPHLRAAVAAGSLTLPFELPAVNPLKVTKVKRLELARGAQ